MVRAPCCEKMGLKKGPWTPEEDQVLINYIKLYGHSNWRALPKQAGLLRCGKSCRLRWTNYLRPDIKRGNFTREEEDTIIKLHEMLGNRWSAIAARLPGRTDNEIKNVWHTHLKKRLKQNTVERQQHPVSSQSPVLSSDRAVCVSSPQQSSSEVSTVTTSENKSNNMFVKVEEMQESLTEIDENFWLEVLSADNSGVANDFDQVVGGSGDVPELQFPGFPLAPFEVEAAVNDYGSNMGDINCNTDFWYNLFTRAGDLPELPEI